MPIAPTSKPSSPWRANAILIALAVLSILLSYLPVVHYVLLPFEFFTTLIHEGGHALAALLIGGEVGKIVLNPDTSGYTTTSLPGGRLAQGFVASAGYLGAAVFGGVLIVLSAYRRMARVLLVALGLMVLAAMILYVRDIFTLVVSGLFTVTLWIIGVKGRPTLAFYSVNFLAIQIAMNSINDTLTLIRLSMGAPRSSYSLSHSDADTVAGLFLLPAVFWSALWVVFSCGILYFALKKSGAIRSRLSGSSDGNT